MSYVTAEGMRVADGGQVITVTLYNADGSVFTTAQDSIEAFGERNKAKEHLYHMIMKFTKSAYNSFS
jgi:uncharacterized protein YodC (DUF2158 family)